MSETKPAPGTRTFLSRWESGALQFSRLAALFSIGFGAMVTLGWCMHVQALTAPLPGQFPIALSTGISFIACGLSLSLLIIHKADKWSKAGAVLVSFIPLFIGFSIAAHYLRINPFDLDLFLMRQLADVDINESPVGRMAPHSSMGIIASGIALLLSPYRDRMCRYLSQALAVSVFGLGLAVICGYTYRTPLLYTIGQFTPVALLTGVAFLILGMGMFFSRPTFGLAGIVTESGLGGRTARLLLPVALLAPIAFGYLRLFGQKYDWYVIPIDTSLIVLLMGACFSLIVLWHSHFLSRISRREKAAIDALQRNEERTRLIIDRAYDAFVALDREGKVIDWNPQAEKIFGWQRDEILGRSLTECIIPLEHRRPNEHALSHFVACGEGKVLNKRIQLIAQRKSGEQFPIELAVFPVEVGGQATFCAFIQDITDRKRIETQVELLNEQLVQARDQALEGSRLKSEFLANMSHEIRTPMNAVIGLSDLLRRTHLSRDQSRFVDLIVTSGQTLLQIIDDILVFSKIEAGRLDLESSDFDLVSTVESAADLLADQAREKKVSLTTFLSPDIPQRVRGDTQRLKQVLLNLMSNAIKFTDKGRILVRAELQAITDDAVIISFSVSDTGIGISEEGIKILFTPFTQVDGSTTRRHGGTGLGLTISKRLVELMGGTIGVSSTEGKGSTFTFTVPFSHAQAKYDRPIPVTSLESLRLLMVGLPEHEATVVESYVESWGLRSSYATFAEEASLTVAHSIREGDPYMVVLVDSQLPGIDQGEFVRQMRDLTRMANTKLLLLLSVDDIGQADTALQAGFDGTITRPIKQSSLFNSLLALFEPRAVASQHDTLELTARSEPPSTKFVLVAEDNIVNQEVAVLLLEELGFNVHVVSNGKSALEASQDANCQLILMDCQMPEMDGFEATMLIRQREKQSGDHIPIVAMTAHAMEGDRELCLQAGMDDYVSKPVTFTRLREVVQRWLNYRESHKTITFQSLPALTKERAAAITAKDFAESAEFPADDWTTPSRSSQQKKTSEMNRVSEPAAQTDFAAQPTIDASPEPIPLAEDTIPASPCIPPAAQAVPVAQQSDPLQREQIDMTPIDDENLDAERRMLGINRTKKMRMSHDELSKPAEEMLDDAISAAQASERPPVFEANGTPSTTNGGSVGTINMSPGARAMSEVDDIINHEEMTSPMVPPRNRQRANTVNDIEISNLFDYNALESTFGSQSAKKFLNLFASMTPSLLARLETAIRAKRFQAAKDAAHELKGMCATIHIPSMVDLCRGIEESAESSDWTNAETLLVDLKRTFSAAESSIKNL